jgi:AraC family transcriptional activator of pobA
MARAQIPQFFLYGEPPRPVGEPFLHLEALDDRSRPANWNIRPHTHANLSHVFLITDGGGEMRADAAVIAFDAPCLLLAPARVVHGFTYATQTRGSVLTLSDTYLEELGRRARELGAVFARAAALPASGALLSDAFERLAQELAWRAPGHQVAVEALVLTILVEALRLSHHGADDGPRPVGPNAALVARFRERLEARYRSEKSVSAYAAALGVSAKRLRHACHDAAGAAPGRLIQDRLALEAKRLMLYTNMTIAETAYALGFDDPAYFTRFFSRECQVSPRRYRQASASSQSQQPSAAPWEDE